MEGNKFHTKKLKSLKLRFINLLFYKLKNFKQKSNMLPNFISSDLPVYLHYKIKGLSLILYSPKCRKLLFFTYKNCKSSIFMLYVLFIYKYILFVFIFNQFLQEVYFLQFTLKYFFYIILKGNLISILLCLKTV